MSDDSRQNVSLESSIGKRIKFLMILSLAIALIVSLFTADARFSLGLAIGGVLSLINFIWLEKSAAALLGAIAGEKKPQYLAFKLIFRYLLIALFLFLAEYFRLFSIMGILLGLSSFVSAIMIEAIYQFYIVTFKNQED